MLNKILISIINLSSFSYILMTIALKELIILKNTQKSIPLLLTAILLIILLKIILTIGKKTETILVSVSEISPIEKENNLPFLILSLLTLNTPYNIFIIFLILFTIFSITNKYIYNPTALIMGYKQYKIKIEGVYFILLSKRNISNIYSITKVNNLSDYILLE